MYSELARWIRLLFSRTQPEIWLEQIMNRRILVMLLTFGSINVVMIAIVDKKLTTIERVYIRLRALSLMLLIFRRPKTNIRWALPIMIRNTTEEIESHFRNELRSIILNKFRSVRREWLIMVSDKRIIIIEKTIWLMVTKATTNRKQESNRKQNPWK